MTAEQGTAALNKRLAFKLSLVVFAALIFGFAIAPFYDVMCKKLGINGKADTSATLSTQKIDTSRWVDVIFTGNTMPGISWTLQPSQSSMRVRPGEVMLTSYFVKNNGADSVIGVAVPSITPELASLYFKKIECFCFKQQTLKAGESKEMPLRFYVSSDLPKDVNNVTLSYAFFNGAAGASQAALKTQ